MADKLYIKKIMLSDGNIYYLCDAEAAREADLQNYLPLEGGTISGNLTVDQMIITQGLTITGFEYITEPPENVLVEQGGQIKKRSTEYLLEDIGGSSYNVDQSVGVLSFKIGKQ